MSRASGRTEPCQRAPRGRESSEGKRAIEEAKSPTKMSCTQGDRIPSAAGASLPARGGEEGDKEQPPEP
jgi:hypothetical protein